MEYYRFLGLRPKKPSHKTKSQLNKNLNKSAFTIIELAFVILIIGVAIIGITKGRKLVNSANLSKARQETQKSPIHQLSPDLFLWLETTTENSFEPNETEDTAKYDNNGVSIWYDLNPNPIDKHNATTSISSQYPDYYANCINKLPCLRFDGSNHYMTIENSDGFVMSDYSIFIIEQRRSNGENIIIGRSAFSSMARKSAICCGPGCGSTGT